jgi:hypothetical protein
MTRPRNRQLCTIAGCEQPHNARGFCPTHYWRWQHHGDPDGNVPIRNNAVQPRYCTCWGDTPAPLPWGECPDCHRLIERLCRCEVSA